MAKIKLAAASPTTIEPGSIGALLGVQQAEYYVELPSPNDNTDGGSVSIPSNVLYYHYQVINPKLVWRITHNLNTRRFIATPRDYEGNQFSAKIRIIDSNSFEVILSSAMKGTVDVYFDVAYNNTFTVE